MTTVRCAADCGRPLPDDAVSPVCGDCWTGLDTHLGDVSSVIADLNLTIGRLSRTTLASGWVPPAETDTDAHDGLGVTVQPPVLHEGAMRAKELLTNTLWGWVREAIEVNPGLVRQGYGGSLNRDLAVDYSVILLGAMGWLQRIADGANCVTEVRYAIGEARKAIDRAPDMEYAGRCDGDVEGVHCGVEMYAVKGASTVRCRDCGTERDIAEWRRAAVDLAREREEPIGELMRIVGLDDGTNVTRDQVRGWIRRGRLVRAGNIGPTPTYRVGDVLDIVDEIRRSQVAQH